MMDFKMILTFAAGVAANIAAMAQQIQQVAVAAYWLTSMDEDAVAWRRSVLESKGYCLDQTASGKKRDCSTPKIFLSTFAKDLVGLMAKAGNALVSVEAMERWGSISREDALKLPVSQYADWRACETWVMSLRRWSGAYHAVAAGVNLVSLKPDWTAADAAKIRGLTTKDEILRVFRQKKMTPQESKEKKAERRKKAAAESRKLRRSVNAGLKEANEALGFLLEIMETLPAESRQSLIELTRKKLSVFEARHIRMSEEESLREIA